MSFELTGNMQYAAVGRKRNEAKLQHAAMGPVERMVRHHFAIAAAISAPAVLRITPTKSQTAPIADM